MTLLAQAWDLLVKDVSLETAYHSHRCIPTSYPSIQDGLFHHMDPSQGPRRERKRLAHARCYDDLDRNRMEYGNETVACPSCHAYAHVDYCACAKGIDHMVVLSLAGQKKSCLKKGEASLLAKVSALIW